MPLLDPKIARETFSNGLAFGKGDAKTLGILSASARMH